MEEGVVRYLSARESGQQNTEQTERAANKIPSKPMKFDKKQNKFKRI